MRSLFTFSSRIFWVLSKTYLHGRSCLNMNKNDVVLALFPKTGSTWVRYFLYNLLCLEEKGDAEVSIDEMNEVMPEYAHPTLFKKWPFNSSPRIIKTHRSRNRLLSNRPTVLVVRDPRDVAVSFYHYAQASKNIGFDGSLKEFIRHPTRGLESFFSQFNSWRDQAELVLRYEDLKEDPVLHFTKLVNYLEIPASREHIELAVERSSMDRMREAQENSSAFKDKFSEGFVFARSGASRQWEGLFDAEDIQYWESLKVANNFDLYD